MNELPPSPGTLVAAHFQRVEIAMLARVLATTLAATLPSSMIEVERVRSASDVLRRRPGQAIGVTIRADNTELTFRAPDVGVTEATIKHRVRGIVLSTEHVSVASWLDQLGTVLDHRAIDDAEAGRALRQFITDHT